MKRVLVKTLGCKVNTFDSQAIAAQFSRLGHQLVTDPAAADVAVINSCSVTANADREARYLARRFRRDNPDALVVVTGCYAQTDSAALAAMSEIDLVVPNSAKERLVTLVEERLQTSGKSTEKLPEGVHAVALNRQVHFQTAHVLFDEAQSTRTRALVKIQDGCNGFCTYCLIPYARGQSRSVPPDRALSEITRLVNNGVPEIVLTGIHLGDYGGDWRECGEDGLSAFVERVAQITGLRRLRLSSLEPAELTPRLLDVLSAHRRVVCDHVHLPLQAGHDRILRLMRRSYDLEVYAQAVAHFRAVFPLGAVSADVIAGFPSETEAEFQDTITFIRTLKLASLHVFPYSSRPNTAAARMPGHLAPEVVKERARRLRSLATDLQREFAAPFVGRRLSVLWEDALDNQGRRQGHATNYLPTTASLGELVSAGSITEVEAKGFLADGRILTKLVQTH